MRKSAVALVILASSFGMSAQSSTQPTAAQAATATQPATATAPATPAERAEFQHKFEAKVNQMRLSVMRRAGTDCPVGFSANREALPETLYAQDAAQSIQSQGLQLQFTPLNSANVLEADVTVYGFSGKPHAGEASLKLDTPDTKENWQLHAKSGATSLRQYDLWLTTMYAASWVDLNSVKFADGTTWHASAAGQCRSTPSTFLFINATK